MAAASPIAVILTAATLLASAVRCEDTTTNIVPIAAEDVGERLFLTPFIETNDIEGAIQASQVTGIHPDITSYSGYLTVNKEYASNLFFWFFPAKVNPEEAPLILWLQGGPGLTTLIGLFLEHGPFCVDKDLNVTLREYAWTTNYSVLYVDQPVGTGFSYTEKESGYAQDQTDIVRDLFNFLRQFYALFPDYQNNDLYIAGQSYGGKYVPSITWKILQENFAEVEEMQFHLKGVMIGNGLTDPHIQLRGYSDFFYQVGLVDQQGRDHMKHIEDHFSHLLGSGEVVDAFKVIDAMVIGDLHQYDSYINNVTGLHGSFFNLVWPEDPVDWTYYQALVRTGPIRRALHVGNQSHSHGNKEVFRTMREDILNSTKPVLENILSTGKVRVLLYHGLLDMIIPYVPTSDFYNSLVWEGSREYTSASRKVWKVGGKVAGYVKETSDLVTVAIRNAGHAAPYDQPHLTYDMINRFISNRSFD